MIIQRSFLASFRLALTLSLVFLLFSSETTQAQWVKPPSTKVLMATPGLVHSTYQSEAMQTQVGYSVVLPPGYEKNETRYPVVYWLHGGGGNECSSLGTAASWQELYQEEKIRPVILVYPNGFRSGYMDHYHGKVMVESMIIKELVPLIDSNYRTIATKEGRAVHGFSMGASGALKFAIKYPNMFCTAVAYGGGAINLETSQMPFIVNILKRNLNSDPELIRQNNTYHFLPQNHETVHKNGTRFLLICGEKDKWKESAITFHAALKELDIPCELKLVPNVKHNLNGLVKSEGKAAALFQDEIFRMTK